MTVRVRFAPSPTGELHVGGARTAVFNWLFARHEGGKFLLRIEDTDKERSSKELVEQILEGLRWIGLDWDENAVFQSARTDLYKENALGLLESGYAYRCFCTPEELLKGKETAMQSGAKSWKYPGRCRDLSDGEIDRLIKEGKPYAIRFKVLDGKTEYVDLVHGETSFDNSNIEDFILLRSDGSPTYHLSVVSDDIGMRITHVIRGDDHISNTPKQVLLYEALGYNKPKFAHIPLILGPDKKRLSKRHGATSLLAYRDKGYLPQAMFNFISLLGWSPGDDREFIYPDDIIHLFTLEGVGKSGAVFDEQKLEWLNSQYINEMDPQDLLPYIKSALEKEKLWDVSLEKDKLKWFEALIDLLKPRCKRLTDFARDARAYLTDDFDYDEQGVKKHLKRENIVEDLLKLRDCFVAITDFNQQTMEDSLRNLAEELGINAAKLIHPLRMALVGVPVSPGVFEVAEILGKEKTIERIERLVKWLEKRA
jgi:glutamyl-tRNA synthetase